MGAISTAEKDGTIKSDHIKVKDIGDIFKKGFDVHDSLTDEFFGMHTDFNNTNEIHIEVPEINVPKIEINYDFSMAY